MPPTSHTRHKTETERKTELVPIYDGTSKKIFLSAILNTGTATGQAQQ